MVEHLNKLRDIERVYSELKTDMDSLREQVLENQKRLDVTEGKADEA